MSTLKIVNLQIGQSVTPTDNFTIYQPTVPDGTFRIGSGNAGTVTDVIAVNSSGTMTIGTGTGGSITGLGTLSATGNISTSAGAISASGDITSTAGNISASGDIQATSYNGGQLAGLRNKIINGNMGIAQRGTAAVTTSGNYGPADKWTITAIGDTFSATQGSFVSGDTLYDTGGAQFYTTIAVTSALANTNACIFRQLIEDVRLLAGKTVTVSFWAKSASGTPSIAVSVDQFFGAGGSPSSQASGTGQAQALTATWTQYTKTFAIPSINGKTIGTTANTSYTILNFWLDAGSDFSGTPNRAASIGQSSKTVSIAQVQLEIGSVATPFEFRPIGMELTLCQRYYEKSFPQGTTPATALGSGASCAHRFIAGKATTGLQYTNVKFSVPKLKAGTVVLYNPISANAQVRDGVAGADCSAAATTVTENNLFITCNGSATTAVGNYLDVAWAVEAEL